MNNLETIKANAIEIPLTQIDRETASKLAAASGAGGEACASSNDDRVLGSLPCLGEPRASTTPLFKNTVAVLAVNRYLTWQGFETNLKSDDDWQVIERLLLDTATIEIVGLGSIGIQVVAAGQMTLDTPVDFGGDKIGYLTLELVDEAASSLLLGFCTIAASTPIWRDMDEFVVYLSELQDRTPNRNDDGAEIEQLRIQY